MRGPLVLRRLRSTSATSVAASIVRTYAEGRQLSDEQIAALKMELDPGATQDVVFQELNSAIADAMTRVRSLDSNSFAEQKFVGRKKLPTTVGGLLVHVADHTQRHVGQAITTAKIVGNTAER